MKARWKLSRLILLFWMTSVLAAMGATGFLFAKKNINQLVNDPFQVKKQDVSIKNLFSWLNLKTHIRFRLWTRKNPKWAQEIIINDLESLTTSNFDPKKLTKILIHGYAHSVNEIFVEEWLIKLRDSYLKLADLNIISIDYALIALPIFYWSAAPDLATEQLCSFIEFLVKHGLKLDHVHMLGFSWGAHVAGNAGHKLSGQISRITGFDPANPTYRMVDNDRRLDKTDAKFVDIIHTNGGGPFMQGHLGLDMALGHADFYPNSGNSQPGCQSNRWWSFYEDLECDHVRSVLYFVESITSPWAFKTCACDSWPSFVRGKCYCELTNTTYMGEHVSHRARGKFYLFTRGKSPYGLGYHDDISLPDIET